MKIDIFPTPIFVGNIDCDKIIFKEEGDVVESWASKTPSNIKTSHTDNILEPKSFEYVMGIIYKLIEPYIKREFTMEATPLWTNKYKTGDYQEAHVHRGTFSYCIYKKITKSQTVFYRPNRHYVESVLGEPDPRLLELYPVMYVPELRENQIVVFPSFLEHMVGKFDEAAETISGNIFVKYTDKKSDNQE